MASSTVASVVAIVELSIVVSYLETVEYDLVIAKHVFVGDLVTGVLAAKKKMTKYCWEVVGAWGTVEVVVALVVRLMSNSVIVVDYR